MHPFIFMLVLSCIAAGVFGSAILARDPGQRANRLIATVLGCSAYWSLCEILWNLNDDPNTVLWMIRLSSFGWIPLGPLALDLFVEVTGKRALPIPQGRPGGLFDGGRRHRALHLHAVVHHGSDTRLMGMELRPGPALPARLRPHHPLRRHHPDHLAASVFEGDLASREAPGALAVLRRPGADLRRLGHRRSPAVPGHPRSAPGQHQHPRDRRDRDLEPAPVRLFPAGARSLHPGDPGDLAGRSRDACGRTAAFAPATMPSCG